jgi:voltage-gated potassium channel
MVALGFIWLALLAIELVKGSNPLLETLGAVIWVIFVLDFILKFIVAPGKGKFIRSNILLLISLAVPPFRILRVLRVIRLLRFTRGLRLVKILSSLNRGMAALSRTMKRRAFGYVVILTLIVTFGGAAGMYAFEDQVPNGLNTYGTSVWWTTMIMTTLGSEYWPKTPEGRILCIILSVYAFAVFGYITATIATFFVDRDAADKKAALAGSRQLDELRNEIQELKKMITDLSTKHKSVDS